MRVPTFVPVSKPVEQQIQDMRQRRIEMAIVLDEYGGTAGLLTLEDLIEEIVGEIHDEHELDPRPFEETPDGETRFDGVVPAAEVNERLDLSIPEEDYDTAGGFVFGTLGRVPEVGDEVAVPEGVLRVVAMEGRRVARLAFVRGDHRAKPAPDEPSDRPR
jgi:putative hemolysin